MQYQRASLVGSANLGGRLTLIVFLLASTGWTLIRLDDTSIALAVGLVVVLASIIPQYR